MYVALRSDECTAVGVGLWHTDFDLLDGSAYSELQTASIVKRILMSEFSRDVLAFKQRVGLPLEETPGVLVMPVTGYNMGTMPPIFGNPYHANVITRFRGDRPLVGVGVGMGGANNIGANVCLGVRRATHFDPNMLNTNTPRARVLHEGKLTPIVDIENGTRHLDAFLFGALNDSYDGITQELGDAIEAITTQTPGSVYLEFGLQIVRWSVLQCANVQFEEVTKPDVPDSQKIVNITPESRSRIAFARFGCLVSGRKVVEADHVIHLKDLDRASIEKLRQANKDLSNYVLVVDRPSRLIALKLSFVDYSNAAAIVSNHMEVLHGAASHFSGSFREAGIVALVGEVNKTFLEGLKAGEANERKLTVYANDAHEEAFVATRD